MIARFVVGCKLPRDPDSGMPSLVSWHHRLFIPYIGNYPPYLEAVSSIRNLCARGHMGL